MKTLLLRALGPVVAICIFHPSAEAQDLTPPAVDPTAPIAASVDFGSGGIANPAKNGRSFEQIGLAAQQTVNIAVQYPAEMAGQLIIVETLDGGRVIASDQAIATDDQGVLSFQFQGGTEAGLSRVNLFNGSTTQTVQFWIIAAAQP